MSIYEFKINDWEGNEIDFNRFKGKVLLIVNTATKCGFTPQYDELDSLYNKYKDKGLEILDFPCNQFFKQAPGTDSEYHSACRLKFMVEFLQFTKVEVNGKNEHPLYTLLKEQTDNKKISWNFNKFLVDKSGNVIGHYYSREKPFDLEGKIIELLNQ